MITELNSGLNWKRQTNSEKRKENRRKSIMSDLERARALRMEADMLEQKERIRSRLHRLIAVSRDPEYDRYLAQLLKDLESGKATPAQVERETERSYAQYRSRMASGAVQFAKSDKQTVKEDGRMAEGGKEKDQKNPSPQTQSKQREIPVTVKETGFKEKKNYEFRIGAHIFSLIGAVFVLIAFMIFGFNFLSGILQGLCLYIAAVIWILLSELLLRRKSIAFSNVITGIGIGGLYAANIINYLVLDTISGQVAMLVTVVITIGTLFFGRKKDSGSIRVISLLGCYICFFPITGFKTALSFLVTTIMLLLINVASIFLKSKRNPVGVSSFHVWLNLFFTVIITWIAWADDIDAVYLILGVMTSFIFVNVLCVVNCRQDKNALFPVVCVAEGTYTFLLFLIGSAGPGFSGSDFKLYVQLVAKVLILAVSVTAFLFWNKEDGRRWHHIYYPAFLVISLRSVYNLDVIIATLLVFFAVKLMAGHKEVQVLDAIVTAWTALTGLLFVPFYQLHLETLDKNPILNSYICLGIFVLAILGSAGLIRRNRLSLYFELLITGFMIFAVYELFGRWELQTGWFFVIEAGVLLILFLLFNHLPTLKHIKQFPYNVTSACVMALFYLTSCRQGSLFTACMVVLGTAAILIMFRERYQLATQRKYLMASLLQTFLVLTGKYNQPALGSVFLMVIALCCVRRGFRRKDKADRIYGLAVAIFTCFKLVVYDFRGADTIYRVIIFFIVGIMTLGIAFYYILLEKKEEKAENNAVINKNE